MTSEKRVSCEAPESEALIFLAAGTLAPHEQAAAAAHLGGCAACRAEWPELRGLVEGLREQHLSPEQIVAAAETGARDDHIELCRRCADEVAALREVNRRLRGGRVPAVVPAWSLAAVLAVGIAAGYLVRTPPAAPVPSPDD